MKYLRVEWIHSLSSEPVCMYSEIDGEGWETRKVEVYRDGRMGYASSTIAVEGSGLSKEPFPPIEVIAGDAQFRPSEIDKLEFEQMWNRANNP